VTLDGKLQRTSLDWAGGFGDITAVSGGRSDTDFHELRRKSSTRLRQRISASRAKPPRARPLQGHLISPAFRTSISPPRFLPPFDARGDLATIPFTVTGWTYSHETTVDGKTETEIVPQVAVGLANPFPLDLRVYGRPQEH